MSISQFPGFLFLFYFLGVSELGHLFQITLNGASLALHVTFVIWVMLIGGTFTFFTCILIWVLNDFGFFPIKAFQFKKKNLKLLLLFYLGLVINVVWGHLGVWWVCGQWF